MNLNQQQNEVKAALGTLENKICASKLIEVGEEHFPDSMTENQKTKAILYLISEFSRKAIHSDSPFFKKIIEDARSRNLKREETK
jgi:hypothetical protein